jgi:DNA-binding Lrp family transcriptional regulator
MGDLAALERALINRYQGGFPLCDRPFAVVADDLGWDENGVIEGIGKLRSEGWLSRFGPLYNADRMGGGLILAAMAVPEADFARVADAVNAFEEVAHNYRRDHRLNMWFVLATDTPEAVAATLEAISAATGLPVYGFPKLREYYLGLWFEIGEDETLRTRSLPLPAAVPDYAFDDLDRRIVAVTQGGLPLDPWPYDAVAKVAACTADAVRARLQAMLDAGVIRRIGVVPNHYKLGFRGNGMSVWDVPDEVRDAVGERIGALDYVSHCYARPRHQPDWPYNLFAMVHGRDRAAVNAQVESIARMLDGQVTRHEVLFSSAVLKKTGMRLPVAR